MKKNKITGYTLTPKELKLLGFSDKGKCPFPNFTNMNYWVKNGICLFYNTPEPEDYQAKYYIGYAEQRCSNYVAVAFRWIDTVEELTTLYETLTQVKITDKIL